MTKVKGQGGFTLIELAIVLVIIGIILGAVLKGQDLINSARAKQFANWNKHWETMQWTFLDRNGRFAGDGGRDGVIGNPAAEHTLAASAVEEIRRAHFANSPTESLTMGGHTFHMRMGNEEFIGPPAIRRNVMVICPVAGCGTAFAADALLFAEALDTAIDGVADAGAGNVRAATAVTLAAGTVVTDVSDVTGAGTSWATTHLAVVYYFDRPR